MNSGVVRPRDGEDVTVGQHCHQPPKGGSVYSNYFYAGGSRSTEIDSPTPRQGEYIDAGMLLVIRPVSDKADYRMFISIVWLLLKFNKQNG